MRFRVQLELAIETESLAEAQAVLGRVERAAHDATGASLRDEGDALWRAELTPLDEPARQAFADDGLGPGLSSGGFTTG